MFYLCSIITVIETRLKLELAPPRPFIDATYSLTPSLYDVPPETMICRCECITMKEILKAIDEGCVDPNEIKALLRPVMGPCQGQVSGRAIFEIISMHSGKDIREAGSLNIRPPLKNIPLSEIAEIELLK